MFQPFTSLSRCGRAAACCVLLALLWQQSACVGSRGGDDAKVARAEYGLASDAFHRARYREALAHVTKALERDDENAQAAYLGTMVMLVFCADDEHSPDCRYDEAERYARLALRADPHMRDATNALGVVLIHRGRSREAISVLRPLSRDMLYQSPEKAWGNLGWAYLDAGETDLAIAALKRSVAAQPLFCVGHYRLGLAFEKKGELAAARHALTRAVTVPEQGCDRLQAAFSARARVEEHLGMRAEVEKDLLRCRELADVTPVGKACARRLRRGR